MNHSEKRVVGFFVGFTVVFCGLFFCSAALILFAPEEPILLGPSGFLATVVLAVLGAVAGVYIIFWKLIPGCVALGCELLDEYFHLSEEEISGEC